MLSPPFAHLGGYMYEAALPPDWPSDSAEEPRRSTLVLLEEGQRLGPAHSTHNEIRSVGRGMYAHWQSRIQFSSSDNSDPNLNARLYSAQLERALGLGEESVRPRINSDVFEELERKTLDKQRNSALSRLTTPGRPRLIYWFTIDALRSDVVSARCNGVPVMPALDRFSTESVSFPRAYAQSSMTKISVASMFTGLWPARHGVMAGVIPTPNRTVTGDNGVRICSLDPRFYTLAEYLNDQGYEARSHLFTIHVEKGDGMLQGFSRLDFDPGVMTPAEWPSGPQFIYEHIPGLHAPYSPSATAKARLRMRPPVLLNPASPEWMGREVGHAEAAELKDAYLAEGSDADMTFARRIDWLKVLNVWDDAMIIVTADHGEEFGEHGTTQHANHLYEEVIRVPLFLKFPKSSKYSTLHGKSFPHRVRLIDVFPTIREVLAGPSLPYLLDGVSICRILEHEERDFFLRDVYARWGRLFQPGCGRAEVLVEDAIISGTLKAHFGYRLGPSRDTSDPVASGGQWIAELYDLLSDPGERRNIAVDRPSDFLRLAAQCLASATPLTGGNPTRMPPTQTQPERDLMEELRALGYADD